jgi:hypothetical protein
MKNYPHPPSRKFHLPGSQRKILALLAILVLFLLTAAAWSMPDSSQPSQPYRVEATHTLVPTHSKLVNTPNPQELQSNHSQTDGIAIMGGVIVLVIVAGTFFVLRRKS